MERWRRAIDIVADLGADAVIVADPAVMAYACEKHPNLRLHMSVQGSATNYEAINLMKNLFGISEPMCKRPVGLGAKRPIYMGRAWFNSVKTGFSGSPGAG